ncbi:hypothetical protein R1sor_008743 [Riccia sorocarpa]|uniref:Probable magnesium transporter n=1 Tax=Riccia sorocarpa TaxID=122646 RepID=A0ABD3HX30_9MARC
MWEAVVFTVVASAGNNIGKVLQKQGTKGLPKLSLKLKVIRAYLLSRTWVTGVTVDILGGLLMLKAVSQAPVSIVQPVSGVGLGVLAVFSHFYLRESMQTLDWLAVFMAALGTIGVGITGEEQKNVEVSLSRLLLFLLCLLLFFVILNIWTQSGKQRRKSHEDPSSPISGLSAGHVDVMEEITAGLQAGALFGLSAVLCKLGFLLAEKDISALCIPAGLVGSVICSTAGFFYQTKNLKDGRAVVVSTCAAVASIVTGVLVGFLALGESLPVSPVARIFLCFGWVLLIAGIILLLVSDKLGRMLPRPVRRLIKMKSSIPSRSPYARSGSATIQVVNPQLISPPKYRS